MTPSTSVRPILAFFLLFSSSICLAAGPDSDCGNAQTQGQMNACAADQLKQADAELNQVYVAYRAKLNQLQQNQMRDVQLAWIKYRDLSCRYEASGSAGGSVAGMVLQTCLAEKTRQRTAELKKLGQCEEGDVSCVR